MATTKRSASRVATKAGVSTTVKTVTTLLAIGALSAAAAALTVQLRPTPALTMLVTSPSGVSQVAEGTSGVSTLKLQLRGGPGQVSISNLNLSLLGDVSGSFGIRVANNLPAGVLSSCVLSDANGNPLAKAPVNPPGHVVFSLGFSLAARQVADWNVNCSVGRVSDGTPDIVALGLPNTGVLQFRAALAYDANHKPIATSGLSFGGLSSLNMNGAVAVRVMPAERCYADVDKDGFPLAASASSVAWGVPCPAGFVKARADGALDCNDNKPAVHPGAVESCNGVDDNCDGKVDEIFNLQNDANNCGACGTACPSFPNQGAACVAGLCVIPQETCYPDADKDGYPIATGTKSVAQGSACPSGFIKARSDNALDCNDSAANIHPGATDIPGNGVDEDCSGADMPKPAASLTVSVASTPTSTSIAQGAQGVPSLGIRFVPSAGSISLNQLVERVTLSSDVSFGGGRIQPVSAVQSRIVDCTLYNGMNGAAVSGPRYVDANGDLTFYSVNWSSSATNPATLVTKCDFADQAPIGSTGDAYAISLVNARSIVAVDGDLAVVNITGADNLNGDGTVSGQPTMIVRVPAPATPVATQVGPATPIVTLASGSPSGAAIPGFSEYLRFNVTATTPTGYSGTASVKSILFRVSMTDNANTGWNQAGKQTNWSIYDMADPSTSIAYGDSHPFLNASGQMAANTDPIAYFEIFFATPLQIPSGQTKTYSLKIDTSGASAVQDDTVRLDIPSQSSVSALPAPQSAISWTDGVSNTVHDGTSVKNLPVTGGTLVY